MRFGSHLMMCHRCDGLFHKKLVGIVSNRFGEVQTYEIVRII